VERLTRNPEKLAGQCQRRPEGEKLSKTTRTGKATKNKKEAWRSLVKASSSAKGETRRRSNNRSYCPE